MRYFAPANMTESERNKARTQVYRILSRLMVDVPFTMPIYKLPLDFIDAPRAYAATNGFRLFVNPFKWMPLTNQEQEAVMYHEWFHISMFHTRRMLNKKARIWNFATDFIIDCHINDDINSSKMILPFGMLYDPIFRGMTSEEAYKILESEVEQFRSSISISVSAPGSSGSSSQDQDGQGGQGEQEAQNDQDQNNGSNGKPNPTNKPQEKYCNKPRAVETLAMEQFLEDLFSDDLVPAPTDADLKESDLIGEIVKAAEMHKKLIGKLPAFYDEIIKRLLKSQVPWQQIFHAFFKDIIAACADRSFARPKRWSWPYGMVLPSEVGVKKLDVIYVTDTSGSMQLADFEQVGGEINKLLPLINKLTMISCDAAVHEKVTIRQIQDIMSNVPKFKFSGRGGTDFVPGLEAAAKMPHDLVIYHTDGFGNYGKKSPRGIKNLLWILTNDDCQKPPFGRYLVIN